VYNTGTMNQA